MRPHDDVRSGLRLDGLEVVADLTEVLLDDLDGRALGRGPCGRDLRHGREAVLVRPDADRRGVGARRRGGQRDRGERRDDQGDEHARRRLGAQHVLLLGDLRRRGMTSCETRFMVVKHRSAEYSDASRSVKRTSPQLRLDT